MYLILLPKNCTALEITSALSGFLLAVNSLAGYLTVIGTQKSSIILMTKIEEIYSKISNSQSIEDEKIVKNSFSIGLKFSAMTTAAIFAIFWINTIKILKSIFTNSDLGNLSMILIWYPNFIAKNQTFVSLYDPFLIMMFCLSYLLVPEMISTTSAYLSAAFDRLGDKVKDVIDGTEDRSFLETKRKFVECVDLHSDLIKLVDESNRIYGPYSLIFMILISMRICVLGIIIIISDIESAMKFLFVALINFIMVYLLCKIGDLLEIQVRLYTGD
jgi:hypothetical protein